MKQAENLEVNLVIPSRFKNELIAQATLRQLAELGGYDEEDIEEMELALGEACINAIEHSTAGAVEVDMTYRPEESLLTIVVKDTGVGFDRDALLCQILRQSIQVFQTRAFNFLSASMTRLRYLSLRSAQPPLTR